MKVSVKVSERIHRLGRKQENGTLLVIPRFYDFHEKVQFLRNARALRSTGVSISEDYSWRVREIRRNLWAIVRNNRRLYGWQGLLTL